MGLVKTHKQRRQHNDYLQDSPDLEGNYKAVYVHYIEKMQQFREAVASYDEDALRKLIEDANKIKRIIR